MKRQVEHRENNEHVANPARKNRIAAKTSKNGDGEEYAALNEPGDMTPATAAQKKNPAWSGKLEKSVVLNIPQLDIRTMECTIVGDAPLIVHKFSEKTKRAMAEKQQGKASQGREHKDPEADFENSLHRLEDGPKGKKRYGFPAIAFKCAAVTACTSLNKALSKTAARQAFHVIGDMVEIVGIPTMREDMVRVGPSKSADIRYRGEFKEWSCILKIRYNARVFSMEQIVNLINTAGFGVGIGEWRPEKNGQNGLFHVE